jgi:N-acetylglucosaminyl-diphospho-decaprenol L-rhamnosyltransferase
VDKFPSRERATAQALAPRVSAVVVVRDARAGAQAPLDLCLRSALAEPWIDDLVIVDHGNAPDVSAMLRALQADRRDVRVVTVEAPETSAAAANAGAENALGRWLLFLDPDVVLQRGAVARMAAAGGGAQTPWIVGGRLTDTEGRERRAARGGALNTWSAIAVAMDWAKKPTARRSRTGDAPEPASVAAVSGAFMLIPRTDFHDLGGFDEGFATDAADLDLCRRAADAGGSVLFQPDAAGVKFSRTTQGGRKQAQGLARFAVKSAKTPLQRAFAAVAAPALAVLLGARDFIAGRQPVRR